MAFREMIMCRNGRLDEAKAALGQLGELCTQEYLIWDMDVQGLLAEAEKLISGEKQ